MNEPAVEINTDDLQDLFAPLFSFQWHPVAEKYHLSESDTRLIIKGNQGGGTATAMNDAALRVLGIHPVAKRNWIDEPIRMVSKVVPQDHDDESNQQFVEFRKLMPPELWKKKLTARSKVGKIARPGGGTAQVEFLASTQDLDAFMSVQRSAYYQDEEIERVKWDENRMRLAKPASEKKGGDTTLSMTPVKGLDWSYDSLWKRARVIHRSRAICDKFGFPSEERLDNATDISIFCWSTDDNPVMDKATLDNLFNGIDDEDELAMRRYGVFRQVSGRIYKSFESKIHVIPYDKIFSQYGFRRFWNYRIIDYHPAKPWNISWVAVTPEHEWYVFNELLASHDKVTTNELRDTIKEMSLLDEDSELNRRTVIDPLAKQKQANTGFSVFDDLSMGELGLRHCMSADTKNKSGRSRIKTRLINSAICGVPGNNFDKFGAPDERYGNYRPTIWFLSNCKGHIDHFKSWRYVDYKHENVKAVRVTKRESEKWSDYPRNLEFLGALNPVWYKMPEDNYEPSTLFRSGRLGKHG